MTPSTVSAMLDPRRTRAAASQKQQLSKWGRERPSRTQCFAAAHARCWAVPLDPRTFGLHTTNRAGGTRVLPRPGSVERRVAHPSLDIHSLAVAMTAPRSRLSSNFRP
jgi:hypothetical protein